MTRILPLLIAVTLIAGITPVAARMATAEFSPMLIPLVRFGTAGVLLAITARGLGLWKPIARQHWPMLIALGILCVPVNQVGYLIGIKKANASHAGVAYALVPVLIFWISVVMGRARFKAQLGIATLLAFSGAALVSLATGGTPETAHEAQGVVMGDVLLVTAATSWSLFVVLSQPLVLELGAVFTLCLVFLLGTFWHIPVAIVSMLWTGDGLDLQGVTWRGWAGLAHLTFITAYLNYLLWYVVTSRYDLTRSAVVTNAHFIVTVLLEAALYGMSVGRSAIVGSALLLSGIVLATRQPRQPQG